MLKRLAPARLYFGWGRRPVSSVSLKPPVSTPWLPRQTRIARLQDCADLVAAKNFAASRKILAEVGTAPAAPDDTALVSALIESALEFRLYQLAALFYLRFYPTYSIPSRHLRTLLDGLTRYDPKLTPLHVKTLSELESALGPRIRMDAFQKLRLLESSLAVQHADSRQVFTAFSLAEKIDGGVIPDVAISPLIRFFASRDDFGKIARIWKYLRSCYPDTYLSHTDVVFPLLLVFLRRRQYRRLSLEIAEACLSRAAQDPQYAFGVAEAARIAGDDDLASKLRTVLNDELPRPAVGQLMCLYANMGDYKRMGEMIARMDHGRFTAVELGSLVKHYLSVSPDQAFEILDKFTGANKYKVAAYVAVCEHAIASQQLELFKRYQTLIMDHADFNAHGLCTNIQIKWDTANETFADAKRNYQNRSLGGRIDAKQRKIALNALMDLIIKENRPEGALEWLEAEYRRLSLPVGLLRSRLNARTKQTLRKRSLTNDEGVCT